MPKVLRVGRDAANEITLNENSVSRVHAELVITDSGRHYLTDCGSSWGTEINNGGGWEKVTQTDIGETTELRLGRWEGLLSDLLSRAAPESLRKSPPRRAGATMTGFSGVQGPGKE